MSLNSCFCGILGRIEIILLPYLFLLTMAQARTKMLTARQTASIQLVITTIVSGETIPSCRALPVNVCSIEVVVMADCVETAGGMLSTVKLIKFIMLEAKLQRTTELLCYFSLFV